MSDVDITKPCDTLLKAGDELASYCQENGTTHFSQKDGQGVMSQCAAYIIEMSMHCQCSGVNTALPISGQRDDGNTLCLKRWSELSYLLIQYLAIKIGLRTMLQQFSACAPDACVHAACGTSASVLLVTFETEIIQTPRMLGWLTNHHHHHRTRGL